MRINKLELSNFRCFEQYELELADRFTLLIGDNGSGKTAILDALETGLTGFLTHLNPVGMRQDNSSLLLSNVYNKEFIHGQTAVREQFHVLIQLVGIINNRNIEWGCTTNANQRSLFPMYYSPSLKNDRIPLFFHGNEFFISLEKEWNANKSSPDMYFPIVVYYKAGRLWDSSKTKTSTKNPDSRFGNYKNGLKPIQKEAFGWFKTQELASLQKKERRHVLESVREAMIEMIPDAEHVWWDMDWDELRIKAVVQGKKQEIPFHLLSDGYRNMIGMVADIAYRMATLNPQLEKDVIKQTEGIVLIDEIDLHLHPKWQRIVVERLLNTFPKVQFVATTHSPFIIQSLYHKEDCLLWDLEKKQPLEITSKSFEDIAEDLQGVEIPQQSRRFLDMEKAAEEYYKVLKQIPSASEEKKQQLKQKLDELLMPYSDDPAYQAFLKMERLAIEGK